jgi:peptidoglycan L-alanyl-D-glutamate endopeptidase CwlK
MAKFSKRSLKILETCHPDLQKLFKEVIKVYDCSVISGYRDKTAQNNLYEQGRSKVTYPNSKHNSKPSLGIDVCPYPIVWSENKSFYHFAGFVFGVAKSMGITLRWGGDWDMDLNFRDNRFDDLAHFELID